MGQWHDQSLQGASRLRVAEDFGPLHNVEGIVEEEHMSGPIPLRAGHMLIEASARGDIHRDFEAEAQIGEGGFSPLHGVSLNDA